jgi:hypothetical protein
MERNRLILLMVISALIAVYGAVTAQLFFLIIGILLMVVVALPVIARRGVPIRDEPHHDNAEVTADIKSLKESVGPATLDAHKIEKRLEMPEKK